MSNWNKILQEIKQAGSTFDIIRRKYIRRIYNITGRNVIIYYSGWLQKHGMSGTSVSDADKNGFMAAMHKLDFSKGLDLLLHTPGGDTAATESLVYYLRSQFGNNIRAIIPQLAMSAGTMIACACKSIIMGQHSSLGPIDPQYKGLPAHAVVEEFKRAYDEIKQDKLKTHIWQPILSKYNPTFVGECEKNLEWAYEMVTEWLVTGMFDKKADNKTIAQKIVKELSDHALNKSHARHLSIVKCKNIGLMIEDLEENIKLQEAVLATHHATIHTLSGSNVCKIIENHKGVSFIQNSKT